MQIFKKHPFLIPIIAFVALYIWHPFVLGYYSDDWGLMLSYAIEHSGDSSLFSLERLSHNMEVYLNRPLSGIVLFIANSIFGYNTIGTHFFVLTLVFVSIYVLYLFLKELFKFLNLNSPEITSAVSCLFWIASPWILGFTVWFASAINLVSLIFFLLSSLYIIKSWNGDKSYYFISSILYLLSCLTYESFYLQYFIIIAIGYIYGIHKSKGMKSLLQPTLLLSSMMLLAIIWNRLSAILFESAVHKEFNSYWIQTFGVNLISFPYSIAASFKELLPLFILLAIVLSIFIYRAFTTNDQKKSNIFKKLKIVLVLSLLGISISFLIYSFAGYTIWGLGSRSRLLLVPSFYLSIMFGICFYLIFNYLKVKKIYKIVTISTLLLFMSVYSVINTFDWKTAFDIQKNIIHNLPNERLNDHDNKTAVIVDAPFKHNWVSVLDAPWDIDIKLRYGKSMVQGDKLKAASDVNFIVGRGLVHPIWDTKYGMYWDGEILYKGYDIDSTKINQVGESYFYNRMEIDTVNRLLVWDHQRSKLDTIQPPAELYFEPFYNYDYWVTRVYNDWVENK